MLCKWNIPWAHFPSLQIEDDAYQDDLGYSKGVLGKGGVAGPIRGPVVDKKTQVSISKRLQVRLYTRQGGWGHYNSNVITVLHS